MQMDAGKGIAGWALSSGQSISISDAPSDPRFARDIADATGYTPSTVFAIPLETDAGAMGVMEILDAPEGREGAHDESRLVATLARQAAVAIETTRLFRTFGRVMFRAAAQRGRGRRPAGRAGADRGEGARAGARARRAARPVR